MDRLLVDADLHWTVYVLLTLKVELVLLLDHLLLVSLVLLLNLPHGLLSRLAHHLYLWVHNHELHQLQKFLKFLLLNSQRRLFCVRHVQILLVSNQQRNPLPLIRRRYLVLIFELSHRVAHVINQVVLYVLLYFENSLLKIVLNELLLASFKTRKLHHVFALVKFTVICVALHYKTWILDPKQRPSQKFVPNHQLVSQLISRRFHSRLSYVLFPFCKVLEKPVLTEKFQFHQFIEVKSFFFPSVQRHKSRVLLTEIRNTSRTYGDVFIIGRKHWRRRCSVPIRNVLWSSSLKLNNSQIVCVIHFFQIAEFVRYSSILLN